MTGVQTCALPISISRTASAVAVVLGERGSVRVVASWASSTGGGMGRGMVEDTGDSLER